MSVVDAQTAQEMATRHKRSVKAVVNGLQTVNALLAKMMKGDKIKWGGYGTNFEWYVRKLEETSTWKSAQLGTRSFAERDPMDKASLPYTYADETYGVSERSIKSNRAAGSEKLYDIQKENALVAQTALYRALAQSFYGNSDVTDNLAPVGLFAACGNPQEDANGGNVAVAANKSYAGIGLTGSSAITAWNTNYSTMGWTNSYWHPTAICADEVGSSYTWAANAVHILAKMQHWMTRTSDMSGTGKIIKPDLALMNKDSWAALYALLITSQKDVNGVAVGTTDPSLGNFSTIRVGTMDCVMDENVASDAGGKDRVLILDSNSVHIETLNTKSEGLIEGEWDASDPKMVGGVGVYKTWMSLCVETPLALGCVVGCS